MDRINKFINDLLNQRGITKEDAEDLKSELLDHILLLKKEYIDKGHDEHDAIGLALNSFGAVNEIGNGIKKTLPSMNKYNSFSRLEKVNTILFMLVMYFLTVFFITSYGQMDYQGILFYFTISFMPVVTGFIYVNLKLTSRFERIKNLSISLLLFLVSERTLMFIIYGVVYKTYSSIAIDATDLLDIKYIIIFLVTGTLSIILTSLLSEKMALKFRNPYNSKMTSNLLWISSIALILLYYLFPNRWYLLCRLVENIIGSEVLYVDKSLVFLTINQDLIIPNIGFIMLIILVVMLVRKVYIKGIKSMF